MIRTGDGYGDSIRDGREGHINGERLRDVTTHPAFRPLVDIRARIHDTAHEPAHRDVMTVRQDGEVNATGIEKSAGLSDRVRQPSGRETSDGAAARCFDATDQANRAAE